MKGNRIHFSPWAGKQYCIWFRSQSVNEQFDVNIATTGRTLRMKTLVSIHVSLRRKNRLLFFSDKLFLLVERKKPQNIMYRFLKFTAIFCGLL
jgi:hypothetical protein